MNPKDLSQEQVAMLLEKAREAVLAWPPPAPEPSEPLDRPERPPLLRAVPPGYILTWEGREYALPGLKGLGHLLTLMGQSTKSIHVADMVDPTGHAKAGLGQVYETEIDKKAVRAARKALPTAPEEDKAVLKTYIGSAHRRAFAGAEPMRGKVSQAVRRALAYIEVYCPAAGKAIRAELTTGTWCRYGTPSEPTDSPKSQNDLREEAGAVDGEESERLIETDEDGEDGEETEE